MKHYIYLFILAFMYEKIASYSTRQERSSIHKHNRSKHSYFPICEESNIFNKLPDSIYKGLTLNSSKKTVKHFLITE